MPLGRAGTEFAMLGPVPCWHHLCDATSAVQQMGYPARVSDAPRNDWISGLCRQEDLPATYEADIRAIIEPLSRAELAVSGQPTATKFAGVSGPQGSGKSTLALFIARYLQEGHQLRAVGLSLDDVYRTRCKRLQLGRDTHPLLAIRGVLGTHDLDLANRLFDSLAAGRGHVTLPVFDKASDDRAAADRFQQADCPLDVVFFEGWCVGAEAQPDRQLARPVNDLEREEDGGGEWQVYVNAQLAGPYHRLFSRLDALLFLRMPACHSVYQWRGIQEQKLRSRATGAERLQSDADLRRFLQCFERLTRHQLATTPNHADIVVDIDTAHRLIYPAR